MRLVSLNVGLPRLITWKGATFKTGIFKKPISSRIMLRATNLDGDRQADLSVHGGADKAVYGYASEHYSYCRKKSCHGPHLAKTSQRKVCSRPT
jgi:MOSC domain-containing protein YiiM